MAEITSPDDGDDFLFAEEITFSGKAVDPEDGTLIGTSLQWRSDKDGSIGVGTSFSTSSLSADYHVITLTATDSEGKTGSFQIGITVVSHLSPTARIVLPPDRSLYASGDRIFFHGEAIDPEEGALHDDAIEWVSNKDGPIGTDTTFSRNDLSVNEHVIVMTATDSDGKSDDDLVIIYNEDRCWISPQDPQDVFNNLDCGLQSPGNRSYERSLDPDFTFIPHPGYAGPGDFSAWDDTQELTFITNLKDVFQGERSIHFGDAEGKFERIDVTPSMATYRGEYRITIDRGDGSAVEIYAGKAEFQIVRDTSGWVLEKWEDYDTIDSLPTSANLRGLYQQ